MLINELRKLGVEIAAIQETRFNKDTTTFTSNGYTFYCSSKSTHHVFGTAFVVGARCKALVLNFHPINEKLCTIRIKGKFKNYSLICAHAPTNESDDTVKDEFYEQLSRTYNECPGHDIKVILGDLNAKIGREEIFRPTIGKYSLHEETNENGLRVIDFATEKGMVVRSTFFMHKKIHLATWESPDGKTRNQIDHCLIDGRHLSDVIDVRTCRKANVDSDHFVVVATIRGRISRAQCEKYTATKRFALGKLKDPQMANEFADRVSAAIERVKQQPNAAPSWTQWSQVLKDEAIETIGYQGPNDLKTWFDDECAKITEEKNDARMRKLATGTRTALERYKKLRVMEKRLHRRKKKELQNRALSELETLRSVNESRKFYKQLNNQRKGFNPRVNMCRATDGTLLTSTASVLDRWREHFHDLLNSGNSSMEDPDYSFLDENDPSGETVPDPTREEISEAISLLKNNKAPGPDNVPAELLKYGGSGLVDVLHEMVSKLWKEEDLPDEWMEGAMCPLHKKGDKLICNNYRGITLLCTAYKVFAKILHSRLKPHSETVIGEYQGGFRRNRSTSDQIFSLRLILQKGNEFKVHTYHLFIDYVQAYDKTKRKELLVVMKELGFNLKLLRLVRATFNGTRCRVKIQNEFSDPFDIDEGLRQGDELSTLLFNVALEGAMRRAGIQTSRTLATNIVQILGFADDIDIASRTHTGVEETFTKLEVESEKLGLMINENKTKYMKTNSNTIRQQDGDIININGHKFEVVDEFVYLGALIRADTDVSQEIMRRIMAANRCFYGLQRHLRSNLLTRETKLRIYKTLIRPVLLYGSESWPLTRKDENLLLTFERKVLRAIFGAKCDNGTFRRRCNFELENDLGEANVVGTVKVNRLRWAGHVARMESTRAPLILLDNDPEGRRGRGRPKLRWIDCVLADLRTLKVQNWRSTAQDRRSWNSILDQAKSKKWM